MSQRMKLKPEVPTPQSMYRRLTRGEDVLGSYPRARDARDPHGARWNHESGHTLSGADRQYTGDDRFDPPGALSQEPPRAVYADDFGPRPVEHPLGYEPGRLGDSAGRYDPHSPFSTASSNPAPPAPNFAGRGPRGYVRRDEVIHEDVCEALTRHPRLDASDIEVTVQDGEVILQGGIPTRADKHLAEDLALHVRGVRDVRNLLILAANRPREDSGARHGPGAPSLPGDLSHGSGNLALTREQRARIADAGRTRHEPSPTHSHQADNR